MAIGEKQSSYLDAPDSHPDPAVRAAFRLVLAMTYETIGPEDIAPLFELGLDREAIEDVIYTCYLFQIYNRCADAFRFELQDDVGWTASAKYLLRSGYQ